MPQQINQSNSVAAEILQEKSIRYRQTQSHIASLGLQSNWHVFGRNVLQAANGSSITVCIINN